MAAAMDRKDELSEVALWVLLIVCPVANVAALTMMRSHYPAPEIMPFAAIFSVVVLMANLMVPRRLPSDTRRIILAWSVTITVMFTITNLFGAFRGLLPME